MKLSLKLLHAEFANVFPGSEYIQVSTRVPLLSSSSILTPALTPSEDVIYAHIPTISFSRAPTSISVVTSKRYADLFPGCDRIIVPNDTDLLQLPSFLASVFSRYFTWSDSLYDAIARNCDLQTLIDLTVPMVNEPMYFADSSWKMIAQYSGEMEYVNPTWSYQMKFDYLPYSVYSEIVDADDMHIYRDEPNARYCVNRPGFSSFPFISKAIRKDGKHYGNFFIIELGRKLDARDFEIAEHVGDLVATSLYGESEYLASSVLYSSHFIIDVIEGNLTSKSLISDQLNALGWDYEGDFGLSLIMTKDTDPALLSHIMFLANSVCDNVNSFSYQDGVVSIYNNYSKSERQIRTRLAGLARDFNNVVALSNPFTYFSQAKAAYQETTFLSEIAEQQTLNGRMVEFSSYFIDYLAHCTDSASMYRDQAYRLLKHDKDYGTDYCNTLYHWLLLERNTVLTAKHLYVHRNTLKNRLINIEKLIDVDLDNPEKRMQLVIALHPICTQSATGLPNVPPVIF